MAEADPDGDGPATGTDPAVFVPDADPLTETDPLLADTDGGGVPDGEEVLADGTDPLDPADDRPDDADDDGAAARERTHGLLDHYL